MRVLETIDESVEVQTSDIPMVSTIHGEDEYDSVSEDVEDLEPTEEEKEAKRNEQVRTFIDLLPTLEEKSLNSLFLSVSS